MTTYRVVLDLAAGKQIAVCCDAGCYRHEIYFVLRQLSAFSGLSSSHLDAA